MGLDRQTAKQPVGQISTVVGLSATKSGSECDTNPGFRGCLLVADTVAKVENRTRPKISRMLIIRPFCRCGALQRCYQGPWSILGETIWSLTSTRAKRISG